MQGLSPAHHAPPPSPHRTGHRHLPRGCPAREQWVRCSTLLHCVVKICRRRHRARHCEVTWDADTQTTDEEMRDTVAKHNMRLPIGGNQHTAHHTDSAHWHRRGKYCHLKEIFGTRGGARGWWYTVRDSPLPLQLIAARVTSGRADTVFCSISPLH